MGVYTIHRLNIVDPAALDVADVFLIAHNRPCAADIKNIRRNHALVVGHTGSGLGALGKKAGHGQNVAGVRRGGVQIEIAQFRFMVNLTWMEDGAFIIVVHLVERFHFFLLFSRERLIVLRQGRKGAQQQQPSQQHGQQTFHHQKDSLLNRPRGTGKSVFLIIASAGKGSKALPFVLQPCGLRHFLCKCMENWVNSCPSCTL